MFLLCNQVVAAFLTWTTSSSGVEQLFSQLQRSPAEQGSAKSDTDRRLATVMGTLRTEDHDLIVTRARILYSELLPSGKARKPNSRERLDKGLEGRRPSRPSEKQWVRDRRSAVLSAAQNLRPATPSSVDARDMPEELQKEIDKQKKQAAKRKAEAFLDGHLLSSEVDDAVRTQAAKRLKADAACDVSRGRKYAEITAITRLKMKQQEPGWATKALPSPIFFADCKAGDRQRWARCLAKLGATLVTQVPQWTAVIDATFRIQNIYVQIRLTMCVMSYMRCYTVSNSFAPART